MEFNPYHTAIMIGIGAIIIEMALGAATGFELLVIGIIFIIAGAVGLASNVFALAMGTVVVLSILYVAFGRAFIRNTFAIETKKSNMDAVIGRNGLVIKKITADKPGQVKIKGETWRASADTTLEADTHITVTGVDGVTLQVQLQKKSS